MHSPTSGRINHLPYGMTPEPEPSHLHTTTQASVPTSLTRYIAVERRGRPCPTAMLHKLSNLLHWRKKKDPDPNSQEAINKALIKQYGNSPAWAAESNARYAVGLRGSSRGWLAGANGLGAIAGGGGGGGGGGG